MNIIKPIIIDWDKLKDVLVDLRMNNLNLRKYVCFYNKVSIDDINCRNKYTCNNNYDCDSCNMIDKSISRAELANAFNVTNDVIYNWEVGITKPDLEDLLLYSKICQIDLENILVFKGEK